MARFDIKLLFRRGRKAQDVFAERDKLLADWGRTDGYRVFLDLCEREMRDVFRAFLEEQDPIKVDALRAKGKAIYDLIRTMDRKAATVEAAESLEEFAKRQVGEMPSDRAELKELDRALMERALAQPDARKMDSRPAMRPVY